MLERDGHEMDKKLTFSISQTKKKKKKSFFFFWIFLSARVFVSVSFRQRRNKAKL